MRLIFDPEPQTPAVVITHSLTHTSHHESITPSLHHSINQSISLNPVGDTASERPCRLESTHSSINQSHCAQKLNVHHPHVAIATSPPAMSPFFRGGVRPLRRHPRPWSMNPRLNPDIAKDDGHIDEKGIVETTEVRLPVTNSLYGRPTEFVAVPDSPTTRAAAPAPAPAEQQSGPISAAEELLAADEAVNSNLEQRMRDATYRESRCR